MGEGEIQDNGNKRYVRPGEMPWPGENPQSPPANESQPNTDLQSIYGRTGSQNSPNYSKPPIRFMEGERDTSVPNTNGPEWEEVDETGRVRKVHRRPHYGTAAPMSQDKSPTMDGNAKAAEERAKRGSNPGPTPEDKAKEWAAKREDAIMQERRIRQYTDWAPNVVNNDWMGGLGAALAVPMFAMNSSKTMKLGTAFALGAVATQGLQFATDGIDKLNGNDHGFESKWFSDGIIWPSCFWMSAAMGEGVKTTLSLNPQFSKFSAVGSFLARTVPFAIGVGASTMFHGIDKATHADDRNPTYSKWCQPAWWDSALTTFVGGSTLFRTGSVKLAALATIGTYAACRGINAIRPYDSPASEFDKSIVALEKLQKERTSQSMNDAIGHLREFGNFGRKGMKNPWDWQHPLEIPGNLHANFIEGLKHRVNVTSTAPELFKFASVFPNSEHSRDGYAGGIAHAVVSFEAGQRALRWGSVGVEMLGGDSLGEGTTVDLGGTALRNFLNARRTIDRCITYANEHDGQVPEGDAGNTPINKEAEVKMLTELRERVNKSIEEIVGPHDNLAHVMGQIKDRIATGNTGPIYELRADIKERAKYPKMQDPVLTPMLQGKLCRDAAMMNLAMAEIAIESKLKFTPSAQAESAKRKDFITSPMPALPLAFGEAMSMLYWATTKMAKDDPALADVKYLAERAYALYDRAKKAGLPDCEQMSVYLQKFRDGKPMYVPMDYTGDFAVRAAIRNGRNPIKDELQQFDNPPQQTPNDKAQEEAAQQDYERRKAEEEQEAAAAQDRNATMQQAELNLGNAREEYVRANIQAEVEKWKAAHPGYVPTLGEQQGIEDVLRELFDEGIRTGRIKVNLEAQPDQSQSQSNQSSQSGQSGQEQSGAVAQPQNQYLTSNANQYGNQQQIPQQQIPQQQYYSQPAPQMINPKDALQAQVDQYMQEHGGQAPDAKELRRMAQNLSSTNFRMSKRPAQANSSSNDYQSQPQQSPVPVIHQSTPDQ